MEISTESTAIESSRQPIAALIREVAGAAMAPALGGVLVGGLGGRIAMRLSAVVNPSMTGRISENGNRIGSVTPDGTFALVLFGGLFAGLAAGVAWVAVRQWLPQRQPLRRWAACIAAVGLTGFLVVQSNNFDFFILDPAWLHVVMFTAIAGGAGAATEWIDGHLVPQFRRSSGFTIGAGLILLLGGPIAVPLTSVYFDGEMCACDDPPRVAGVLVLIALAATVGSWVTRWRRGRIPRPLQIIGWGATAGAIGAGLVSLAGQISEIL